MSEPLRLVTNGYVPVASESLEHAEGIITDLRSGKLTGFAIVAVGPETSGVSNGFIGTRMDRIQLLGQLTMMQRQIEDIELALEPR